MAERPKSIIQFLIESLFGKQSEKSGKVQGDPPPESPRRKIRWNRVLLVFLPILVAFILTRMAMFSVAESDQAVITTFGRFTKTVDAGLHFKLPWPIQRAYHLPVNRTQKIEIGYWQQPDGTYVSDEEDSMMITGDMNIVNIDFFVEWKISDPVRYLFATENPELILRNMIQASIRSVVGTKSIDETLTTGKFQIQADVKEDLQEKLLENDLGVQILDVKVNDSEPPTEEVAKAFRDVETAKQEKETALNLARQYENSQIPAAQAEADRLIKAAEADKESRINEATGERDRFLAIYKEFEAAPEVSRQRMYLELLEKILPDIKVILDGGVGVQTVLPIEPIVDLGSTTSANTTSTENTGQGGK